MKDGIWQQMYYRRRMLPENEILRTSTYLKVQTRAQERHRQRWRYTGNEIYRRLYVKQSKADRLCINSTKVYTVNLAKFGGLNKELSILFSSQSLFQEESKRQSDTLTASYCSRCAMWRYSVQYSKCDAGWAGKDQGEEARYFVSKQYKGFLQLCIAIGRFAAKLKDRLVISHPESSNHGR